MYNNHQVGVISGHPAAHQWDKQQLSIHRNTENIKQKIPKGTKRRTAPRKSYVSRLIVINANNKQ